MSVLIGVGVVSTITVFYLGRKGWHALHKAVGITPGVLTYHDSQTPRLLASAHWQQLKLNNKHLSSLPHHLFIQLQRIDEKVASYQHYEQHLQNPPNQQQKTTPVISEQQFVLHKLLHTRLPEMLASHHQLAMIKPSAENNDKAKQAEAIQLLQNALNSIEKRLDNLLAKVESEQLQDLKIMQKYMDSQNEL